MIRKMRKTDIDRVADIWLDTNQKAHDFIPASYWQDNFEEVKQMLLQAEVYVWEEPAGIQGFLGLSGGHIEGLFVRADARSRGIGRRLLEAAKEGRDRLTLCVYEQNGGAVRFYSREGFSVERRGTDSATGEAEFWMSWER